MKAIVTYHISFITKDGLETEITGPLGPIDVPDLDMATLDYAALEHALKRFFKAHYGPSKQE